MTVATPAPSIPHPLDGGAPNPPPTLPGATPPGVPPVAPANAAPRAAVDRVREGGLQARWMLLIGGIVSVVLALALIVLATSTYNTAYDQLAQLAETNAETVAASEGALQYVARVGQAAADYTILTSDTPLYEQAQNNIFRDYANFRDEMFTLRQNVTTPAEQTAFTVADTYAENRMWRHLSLLLGQRGNDEQARAQYLQADNHIRTSITPALQQLEALNYESLAQAGSEVGASVITRAVLLGVPAFALAALLTWLSLRVRRQVRRFVTPGLDGAMLLAWVLFAVMMLALLNIPNQLGVMIQDSYRSVTASARVLVDANIANRAESSALLDPEQLDAWVARYDEAVDRVELRMCGVPGCLDRTFVISTDRVDPLAERNAQNATTTALGQIGNVVPLVGNITFAGEASALEQARIAFNQFRDVNTRLRELIAAGDTEAAVLLNTDVGTETSQTAFNAFADAIEQERQINLDVFDQVWAEAQTTLITQRTWAVLLGYLGLIALVIVGVAHRFREL